LRKTTETEGFDAELSERPAEGANTAWQVAHVCSASNLFDDAACKTLRDWQ
jgi:hypothetical protein